MGVTYARKAIVGGRCYDHKKGDYDLGDSFKPIVNKMIAIAGANLGLTACFNL